MMLADVLTKYAVPDPGIVSKLPKGGIQLDFVGHADITRILIEIDPLWVWEPCAWLLGRPDIHVENGIATMWARLTVLDKTMLGVGSARADKADYEKELIGDFLRNAAMRFGICLSLWTKTEWQDLGAAPKPRGATQTEIVTQSATESTGEISQAQRRMIYALGHKGDIPATKIDASKLITDLKAQAITAPGRPF